MKTTGVSCLPKFWLSFFFGTPYCQVMICIRVVRASTQFWDKVAWLPSNSMASIWRHLILNSNKLLFFHIISAWKYIVSFLFNVYIFYELTSKLQDFLLAKWLNLFSFLRWCFEFEIQYSSCSPDIFLVNIFIGLRQCTAVVGNLHTSVLLLTIFCRELSK